MRGHQIFSKKKKIEEKTMAVSAKFHVALITELIRPLLAALAGT